MKIAIISDIHSNLEALTAVLSAIDAKKPDEIICLGDIVGYGANPDECADLIRDREIPTVKGNHDKAAAGEMDITYFSGMAKAGILWSQKQLSLKNTSFLKDLPVMFSRRDAVYVHSSPDFPEEFRYLIYPSDAYESFDYFTQQICFIGHTHRPVIFSKSGIEEIITVGKQSIVNVGSVGQPRDGDWRACYVLFDSDRWDVEHFRVEYDNAIARKKIIAAGLPEKLGDRLLAGV